MRTDPMHVVAAMRYLDAVGHMQVDRRPIMWDALTTELLLLAELLIDSHIPEADLPVVRGLVRRGSSMLLSMDAEVPSSLQIKAADLKQRFPEPTL